MSTQVKNKLYPVSGFDPNEYMIPSVDINGEIIQCEGEPIQYLNVYGKMIWFRHVYPKGSCETDIKFHDNGFVEAIARIYEDTDVDKKPLATGHCGKFMSDDIYSVVQSMESIAISRALSFAGFGAEHKVEYDKKKPTADPENNMRIVMPPDEMAKHLNAMAKENFDAAEKDEKTPETLIRKPAQIEEMPLLDEDDPLARLGVQPPAEALKATPSKNEQGENDSSSEDSSKEDAKTEMQEQTPAPADTKAPRKRGRKPKKQAEPEEERSEESAESTEPTKAEPVDEEPKEPEIAETPADDIPEAEENTIEIVNADEVETDFVIVAEDVSDRSLERHIGKKVSEIDKSTMQSIVIYLKGSISKRLYEAIKLQLGM